MEGDSSRLQDPPRHALDAMRIAFFISPHGFGHAARAAAVMEALHAQDSTVRFELFTTVPERFFEGSLEGLVEHHPCVADIGFRQTSPLEFDVGATREAVEAFIARAPGEAATLAHQLNELECTAVVCDISPLGLMSAAMAGLPSVLIENFTWDWLYEPLIAQDRAFDSITEWMRARFDTADQRIQARPRCEPLAESDLVVPPISRRPRRDREDVRDQLDVGSQAPIVLITMGGVSQPLPFLSELRRRDDLTFIVTGSEQTAREGNLRLFHNAERIFLPDLIQASDWIVAKLGYSTLTEVWAAGRPLGYVGRSDFRETGPLESFARSEIPCLEILQADYSTGTWIDRLDDLLALSSVPAKVTDGGGAAASWIIETTRRA